MDTRVSDRRIKYAFEKVASTQARPSSVLYQAKEQRPKEDGRLRALGCVLCTFLSSSVLRGSDERE